MPALWSFFLSFSCLLALCCGEKSPLYGGTDKASEFDDGPSSGILNITVYAGSFLDALQVGTVEGLKPFRGTNSCNRCSPKAPPVTPGKRLGGTLYQFALDYPNEYISQISGYYGRSGNDGYVVLSIHVTNGATGAKKIYGPFGDPNSWWITTKTPFKSPVGKIVGFWGYASTTSYFRGIGVYLEDPPPPPPPPPSPPPPSPPPPSPPPPSPPPPPPSPPPPSPSLPPPSLPPPSPSPPPPASPPPPPPSPPPSPSCQMKAQCSCCFVESCSLTETSSNLPSEFYFQEA